MTNPTPGNFKPRIAFINLNSETQELEITKDELLIGRSPEADIPLGQSERPPVVSSKHAWVIRRGSDYFLVDKGSHNGTWLNGTRIPQNETGAKLEHKNTIIIDRYQLSFLLYQEQTLRDTQTQDAELELCRSETVRLSETVWLCNEILYQQRLVWLFGMAGLGKTHLLKALANHHIQEYLHNRRRLKNPSPWPSSLIVVSVYSPAMPEARPARLVEAILRAIQDQHEIREMVGGLAPALGLRADRAGQGSDAEALARLDEGLNLVQTEQSHPLAILLDCSQELLDKIGPLWWLRLSELIGRCNVAPRPAIRLGLVARISLNTWQEQILQKAAPTEKAAMEAHLADLRRSFSWVRHLRILNEEEARWLANYCLISVGGAIDSRAERLGTAFSPTPEGRYLNGNPIDAETFALLSLKVGQLAGPHADLTRIIAAAFIQKIWPSATPKQIRKKLAYESDLIKEFLQDEAVRAVCQAIYTSLSPEQRGALTWLAQAQPGEFTTEGVVYHPSRFDWRTYEGRGLVRFTNGQAFPTIFSPLFAAYLLQNPSPDLAESIGPATPLTPGASTSGGLRLLDWVRNNFQPDQCWLTVEPERRTVLICSQVPIAITAPQRWKLFEYLYQRANTLVSIKDLKVHVYGQPCQPYTETNAYIDNDRFEGLVSQLRRQIEPWMRDRQYVFLVNHRGAYELRNGTPPS